MSTPRLKYNPKDYKRIAEIYAWLADGKNVQVRHTGNFTGVTRWVSFDAKMGAPHVLFVASCEFRVKP